MKLNNLVGKPQLIRVELNDEATIAEFGETLEWWIWDRQPLEKFLKLASAGTDSGDQLVATIRDMILDEEGKPLLTGDDTLPTPVLLKVLNKMTEALGK